MCTVVLPNFDWTLSTIPHDIHSKVLKESHTQYRLESGMLIPFHIHSRRAIRSTKSISVEGMIEENHLRIFLGKNMVLCWLYIKSETSHVPPKTRSRLTAYVRYYREILEVIKSGDREILQNWWVVEKKYKHLQHSSSRVEHHGGPKEDWVVVMDNEVDWGLNEIIDMENLALVNSDLLDDAILDLVDWISREVEREVGVENLTSNGEFTI